MIFFDDFKKLDIKIGTIKSAEPIEEAEKLLKLTVDVGEESPRTIVAGIAKYVDELEGLVGKQVPILTNLEPREMFGIESQGMMLGVGGDGFTFLHPAEAVEEGLEVR